MDDLHGLWHASHFHVWGEESRTDSAVPTAPHEPEARSPSAGGVLTVAPSRLKPTATEALHAAIGELSPDGLLASIAAESTIKLWIPAIDGIPVPSTAVASSDRPDGDGVQLTIVEVPCLKLGPADAIDFLVSLGKLPSPRVGPSIRYWQALANYALTLLSRGLFVPGVEPVGGNRFEGRWSMTVSDPNELAWLEFMAERMPAMCRAVASPTASSGPAAIIDGFLASTCESTIRRSLEADEFYVQFHERAETEEKWELCWLSGLIGDRRAVEWPTDEATSIAGQIKAWSSRLDGPDAEAPLRVGFVLEEPEAAETPEGNANDLIQLDVQWRVRFEIHQPETGESIDINQIWQEQRGGPSILGRRISSRSEHVRGELGRAAAIFGELNSILDADAPTGIEISTQSAHAFIREQAPLLVSQGFEVDLPEWAEVRSRRLGLELVVSPREGRTLEQELSLGQFGLSSMLDFNWRIAVGDDHITAEEFETIVTSGAPLVRLRGHWIDVDQVAARKAREFMMRQAGGALTLAQAIRMSAGVEEDDTGLPIVGLSGTAWLERLLNQVPDSKIEDLEQPVDFNGTLRPYQIRGLEWLSFLNKLGIGSCLADDMGLGKTIQLIALLLHERRVHPGVGPTLLFVPMSVVGNWRRELNRFASPLKVLVHHGPERLLGDAFVEEANRSHVIVTTYGLAHRDLKTLQRISWHRLALDEAQKIKNPSAHQTIAIRSLPAIHRVALTGTPLENHLSELWSIMETLNPGIFGSAATFRKQFAVPIEKMGDQKRADQLRRMIRPFVLRRLKSDPLVECDLPEKMEMRVFCNLTAEQAALYKETVQQMLEEIDRAAGIRRRGLILATLTKLKQICNHPAHFLQDDSLLDGRSGKCERLVEMLEEVIEEGDAALIFTQYRAMGDLLQQQMEERLRMKPLFLHGGTPAKQRDEMVDEFQNPNGKTRLFLLSLKAGGFGLNLTRANHVFHFDRWWNPAVEQQATDRAHRIGQTRRVQVHKFVCIGTIEDRIDKLLAEKSALADHIVGSGDEWLTNLTTTELKEYLTLTAEAVADSD